MRWQRLLVFSSIPFQSYPAATWAQRVPADYAGSLPPNPTSLSIGRPLSSFVSLWKHSDDALRWNTLNKAVLKAAIGLQRHKRRAPWWKSDSLLITNCVVSFIIFLSRISVHLHLISSTPPSLSFFVPHCLRHRPSPTHWVKITCLGSLLSRITSPAPSPRSLRLPWMNPSAAEDPEPLTPGSIPLAGRLRLLTPIVSRFSSRAHSRCLAVWDAACMPGWQLNKVTGLRCVD